MRVLLCTLGRHLRGAFLQLWLEERTCGWKRVRVPEQAPGRACSVKLNEGRPCPEQWGPGSHKQYLGSPSQGADWGLAMEHSVPPGWEALAIAAQDFRIAAEQRWSVCPAVPFWNWPLGAVDSAVSLLSSCLLGLSRSGRGVLQPPALRVDASVSLSLIFCSVNVICPAVGF